ncbi:hypothetical protein M2160_008952 [Streptomyces sp. SAI-117]|nr:hypothetical protein [Streptomyces sp. SAI-117]
MSTGSAAHLDRQVHRDFVEVTRAVPDQHLGAVRT